MRGVGVWGISANLRLDILGRVCYRMGHECIRDSERMVAACEIPA